MQVPEQDVQPPLQFVQEVQPPEQDEHPLQPEHVVLHCVWHSPEQDAAQPGELVVVVKLDRSLTTFVSVALSNASGITAPATAVDSPDTGLTAFSG